MSEDGIPSELPKGWAWATLDDLQAAEPGAMTDGPFGSNLKSSHYTESGARVIRLQNIGDGEYVDEKAFISLEHFEKLRKHEVRAGDLAIASLGNELPRACLIPDLKAPAIVKADCIRMRNHPDIDNRWLLYTLIAPQTRAYAVDRIRGVGRPRLGLNEIRRIPVPVPPLEEQRRIAEALDEQISKFQSGDRLLAYSSQRSSQYRLAVADVAVRGKLVDPLEGEGTGHDLLSSVRSARVSQVKGRRLKPAPFSDPGPNVPEHWSVASLDEIAAIIEYGSSVKTTASPLPGAVPVLRMGNIQDGRIDPSRLKYITEQHPDASKYLLEDGDLLFNRTNSFELVGKSAVYRGEFDRMIFASYLIRCRFFPGVDPEWVNLVINSTAGRHYIKSVATQQVGQANVNGTKLARMPVPIPPKGEQRRILDAVDAHHSAARRLESGIQEHRVKAALLRRSLLAEAFAGRLVQQNPADEPADVLLARIRADREAVGATKTRRRSPRQAPAQRERAPDAPPPPSANGPSLATATQPTLDLEIPS